MQVGYLSLHAVVVEEQSTISAVVCDLGHVTGCTGCTGCNAAVVYMEYMLMCGGTYRRHSVFRMT